MAKNRKPNQPNRFYAFYPGRYQQLSDSQKIRR